MQVRTRPEQAPAAAGEYPGDVHWYDLPDDEADDLDDEI